MKNLTYTSDYFNSEDDYVAYQNEIECAQQEQYKFNRNSKIILTTKEIIEQAKNDPNHKFRDINDF